MFFADKQAEENLHHVAQYVVEEEFTSWKKNLYHISRYVVEVDGNIYIIFTSYLNIYIMFPDM